MIAIGSGIRSGYDVTTAGGPVRVYQFPGGTGRLHLRHAAIVVAALLARDTDAAWDTPIEAPRFPALHSRPLLTDGHPLPTEVSS